jgi:hypothetical protein
MLSFPDVENKCDMTLLETVLETRLRAPSASLHLGFDREHLLPQSRHFQGHKDKETDGRFCLSRVLREISKVAPVARVALAHLVRRASWSWCVEIPQLHPHTAMSYTQTHGYEHQRLSHYLNWAYNRMYRSL